MNGADDKKKMMPEKIPVDARRVIAVASGKGGVGKSTVAVNLALALAKRKLRVGLMDADIYGPNVPLMMGISDQKAGVKDEKMVPVERHGIHVISVGFLTPPDQALIWRGPLANKLVEQFLRDVHWPSMDILVIDLPPGTGDVPLSIIQKVKITAGIIVTTPQQASILDVRKMINMYEKTGTPIAGIVENMTHLTCPHCSRTIDLYPREEKESGVEKLGYSVLARFPFVPALNRPGKELYYLTEKEGEVAAVMDNLAEAVAGKE